MQLNAMQCDSIKTVKISCTAFPVFTVLNILPQPVDPFYRRPPHFKFKFSTNCATFTYLWKQVFYSNFQFFSGRRQKTATKTLLPKLIFLFIFVMSTDKKFCFVQEDLFCSCFLIYIFYIIFSIVPWISVLFFKACEEPCGKFSYIYCLF